VSESRLERALATEWRIGRLLIAITYASVALLAIGVGLLLVSGTSPTAGGPGLDVASLGTDLLAGAPAGFLWLGLVAVMAAPISRVVVAATAYARERDWSMVGIALAILAIIAIGVATAGAATV
jgi:uncharacterized membrane protein